jgi:hypothetical protein
MLRGRHRDGLLRQVIQKPERADTVDEREVASIHGDERRADTPATCGDQQVAAERRLRDFTGVPLPPTNFTIHPRRIVPHLTVRLDNAAVLPKGRPEIAYDTSLQVDRWSALHYFIQNDPTEVQPGALPSQKGAQRRVERRIALCRDVDVRVKDVHVSARVTSARSRYEPETPPY